MIKHLLCSLLLLILCCALYGQDEWTAHRNDLSIKIGIIPFMDFSDSFDYGLPNGNQPTYTTTYNYKGNRTRYPAANVMYAFSLKKWLAVGVNLSYSYACQNYYDLITDEKTAKYQSHNLAFVPTVQFTFLSKPYVKLYATAGLGINSYMQTKEEEHKTYYSYTINPAINLKFIGIKVGRRLYGLTELGLGYDGIVNFGLGYNF